MKNQFHSLQGWIPEVLNVIKKDIKTEHLPSDAVFYKTHFGNRPLNRLNTEEIFAAYEKELLKGEDEGLSEWIVNRWVFKHGDLYTHFAERLSSVNPDFEEIRELTEGESKQILEGAAETYGAITTFLFSVLNGVVFPEAVVEQLRKAAEEERSQLQTEAKTAAETQNLEQLIERHRRDLSRLHEKYESKLTGVQKKYTTDTEALKKQVRSLQQKLNSLTVSCS